MWPTPSPITSVYKRRGQQLVLSYFGFLSRTACNNCKGKVSPNLALEQSKMPKTPFQQLAYFLDKLRRLKNYVKFSEKNWEEKLARYNLSLTDDDLNLKSFGGQRGHWSDL